MGFPDEGTSPYRQNGIIAFVTTYVGDRTAIPLSNFCIMNTHSIISSTVPTDGDHNDHNFHIISLSILTFEATSCSVRQWSMASRK